MLHLRGIDALVGGESSLGVLERLDNLVALGLDDALDGRGGLGLEGGNEGRGVRHTLVQEVADGAALLGLLDIGDAALELLGQRVALLGEVVGGADEGQALVDGEGRHVGNGRGAGLDLGDDIGGLVLERRGVAVEVGGGLLQVAEASLDVGENRGDRGQVALDERGRGALDGGSDKGVGASKEGGGDNAELHLGRFGVEDLRREKRELIEKKRRMNWEKKLGC